MRISHKEEQCIFTQPRLEESNNCPNTEAPFSGMADDLFQETLLTEAPGMSSQAKMPAEIGLDNPSPPCPSAVRPSGLGWVRCQPGTPHPHGCGSGELHRHLCHGESDWVSQRWHSAHTEFSFRVILSSCWGTRRLHGASGRS